MISMEQFPFSSQLVDRITMVLFNICSFIKSETDPLELEERLTRPANLSASSDAAFTNVSCQVNESILAG